MPTKDTCWIILVMTALTALLSGTSMQDSSD